MAGSWEGLTVANSLISLSIGAHPTASDIVSLVTGGAGAIRIPIDYYVRTSPRLDGNRSSIGDN